MKSLLLAFIVFLVARKTISFTPDPGICDIEEIGHCCLCLECMGINTPFDSERISTQEGFGSRSSVLRNGTFIAYASGELGTGISLYNTVSKIDNGIANLPSSTNGHYVGSSYYHLGIQSRTSNASLGYTDSISVYFVDGSGNVGNLFILEVDDSNSSFVEFGRVMDIHEESLLLVSLIEERDQIALLPRSRRLGVFDVLYGNYLYSITSPSNGSTFGEAILLLNTTLLVCEPEENSLLVFELNQTQSVYVGNYSTGIVDCVDIAHSKGWVSLLSKDGKNAFVMKLFDNSSGTIIQIPEAVDALGFGKIDILIENYNSSDIIDGRLIVSNPLVATSISARGRVFSFEYNNSNSSNSTSGWTECQSFEDLFESISSNFGSTAHLLEDASLSLVISAPGGGGGSFVYHYELKRYQQCFGCDGIENSCNITDQCGQCGGNGTSCLDCEGIVDGTKNIDYCGECVSNSNANDTCFDVFDRPNSTVECLSFVIINNATWEPGYPDARLHWFIIPPFITHGLASIGNLDGQIEYQHTGTTNTTEIIYFRAEHPNGLEGNGTVSVEVQGCQVVGCDGIPGSNAETDQCGVCNGADLCVDCTGVPFGNSTLDVCGVCNGMSSCLDCTGTINGTTVVDSCGICGGNNACVDCFGQINGTAQFDLCAVCNGTNDCLDCFGVPFGSALVDQCGVCGGTNDCVDCNGVPFGNSQVDLCAVCNGTNDCLDCFGVPFGSAIVDLCGVCGGIDACIDCFGQVNGGAFLDQCQVCNGTNDCLDCFGDPFGSALVDQCGVCGGTNDCVDCNGVPFGGSQIDLCGVCGGTNDCLDCFGVPFGSAIVDLCGVCGGIDACVDCFGQVNGGAILDQCQVCNGTNDCLDCFGIAFGNSEIDLCGVCGGTNDCIDCFGQVNGGAFMDQCQVCNGTDECVDCEGIPFGGKTLDVCNVCGGDDACLDCEGTINGTIFNDMCGVCGGNTTKLSECTISSHGDLWIVLLTISIIFLFFIVVFILFGFMFLISLRSRNSSSSSSKKISSSSSPKERNQTLPNESSSFYLQNEYANRRRSRSSSYFINNI